MSVPHDPFVQCFCVVSVSYLFIGMCMCLCPLSDLGKASAANHEAVLEPRPFHLSARMTTYVALDCTQLCLLIAAVWALRMVLGSWKAFNTYLLSEYMSGCCYLLSFDSVQG